MVGRVINFSPSKIVWQTWNDCGTCSSTTVNNVIWSSWNGNITSETTAISTSANYTWRLWNNSITSGATDYIWNTWQDRPRSRIIHATPRPPQPDRWREEALKREEARKLSKSRARKLLIENMTKAQREQYEKHGHFDVKVNGKTYRIYQGTHGNVRQLDAKGHTIESYCVQPSGVPDEDAMLAQKLALELAPNEFFAKANVTIYPRN